ncbi:MAG: hypothetical protein RLZZ292_718 [Bacteroidota bacterium]
MKKPIPFLFLLFFTFLKITAQTTTIDVSNTVTNPNPLPFGINWAEGNANRNLNALNNFTGDPGFGRSIVRIKGTLDGGSSTYAEHKTDVKFDYYETVYTGMFNGGNIRIYRETPTGVDLIRDEKVISFFADTLNGYRANFASGAPVQAGDIYVISTERSDEILQYAHPRLDWVMSGAANTWRLSVNTFAGGDETKASKTLDIVDKPTNGGSASCRVTNTDAKNEDVGIGQYISNSVESNEFSFEPTKKYRFTVWMKQKGIAGGVVNLKTSQTGIDHNFVVDGTWKEYTFDTTSLKPIPDGYPVDDLGLTFDGAGTLWIDNFTLHDTQYPLYSLFPSMDKQLEAFKPHCIRFWSGQTNTDFGTNIGDWTDTELQSARLWSANGGPGPGSSLKLPTALPICEKHDIQPYLICSPSFSESDFLGLMEYLGGSSSTTYGAKRIAQGHPAPYTNSFKKIYLEFGNETWNGLFAPWTYDFNGALYGKFAQHFYDVVKSSPYYDANKFELVVGGFLLQADQYGYGNSAKKLMPDGQHVVFANYIGGFDGLNIPKSPTFADSIQQTAFYARWITRHVMENQLKGLDEMKALGYNNFNLGIYEAGPGYALPDPSKPFDLKAEAIGKSLACGVANLDAFLYQSEKGFQLQNLFLFAKGYNWSSHTSDANGYRPHNHFLALQMRNRYAKGAMVTTKITNSPTTYMPLIDSDGDGQFSGFYGEAPAGELENIASYCFKDGKNYSIFVLNRNITNAAPITINLPTGAKADSVKLYKLTGDPTQSNNEKLNFEIQEEVVPNFKGNTYTFTMPAGSIYLFSTKEKTMIDSKEMDVAPSTIIVYPNPTKRFLNVKMLTEDKNLTMEGYEIYNNLGQIVLKEAKIPQNIDLQAIQSGIYLLKVGGQFIKFVKE